MSVQILRGNALALPLADDTVDLVVTSPPYFGLRSYQDGGEHYDGQIGDEATPAEFVDALVAATAEMVRVTKPTGSIFVNLGDKYASSSNGTLGHRAASRDRAARASSGNTTGVATKSLLGIPWRYANRCVDDLGLILRAEIIWSKPNGLPESVTDRVRRSHETWFHFTLSPRYYSAVDEIREAYEPDSAARRMKYGNASRGGGYATGDRNDASRGGPMGFADAANANPLGKLPGSVWTIPTEPLHVPDHLGIDHFAAYPTEWPRRIIQGWSPSGICTACGEGRRPTGERDRQPTQRVHNGSGFMSPDHGGRDSLPHRTIVTITGEACACPAPMVERATTAVDGTPATELVPDPTWRPTAPTRPATVLDPFGGTGTTALVADALGRNAVHVDMSADYCRLATWRTSDPKQRAKAARREFKPPAEQIDGQLDLLEGLGA